MLNFRNCVEHSQYPVYPRELFCFEWGLYVQKLTLDMLQNHWFYGAKVEKSMFCVFTEVQLDFTGYSKHQATTSLILMVL